MEKGTVLFHSRFEFKNGETGEKLLVLLNDPDPKNEPYLFCRTTSKLKNKSLTPGCQAKQSLFLIPASNDFFQMNTWLQLHEIFPAEASSVLRDHFEGALQIKGKLTTETIGLLMKCIAIIQDISSEHKNMILKNKK